jgi:hypothetical protein
MKRLIAISCVLAAVVVIISQRIDAQEPDHNSNPFAQPAVSPDPYGPASIEVHDPNFVGDGKRLMLKFRGADGSKDAIRHSAEKLRDATSDEAKGKAQGELRRLLSEYFEKDMKRRKTDLDEMEKRLGKLRNQLERRQAKMDEIVDLQIKVLINEADGLGFFSGEPQSDFLFEKRHPLATFERATKLLAPTRIEAVPLAPIAPPVPVDFSATPAPAATQPPTSPAAAAQPGAVPTPAAERR